MAAKPPKRPREGTHDPSQKSLQRWDTEGGAPKGKPPKRPRDFNQAGKLVIDIATGQVEDREPTPEEQGKDPAAAALGRKGGLKGGKARAEGMTAERRREIAQAAARKRWSEK